MVRRHAPRVNLIIMVHMAHFPHSQHGDGSLVLKVLQWPAEGIRLHASKHASKQTSSENVSVLSSRVFDVVVGSDCHARNASREDDMTTCSLADTFIACFHVVATFCLWQPNMYGNCDARVCGMQFALAAVIFIAFTRLQVACLILMWLPQNCMLCHVALVIAIPRDLLYCRCSRTPAVLCNAT